MKRILAIAVTIALLLCCTCASADSGVIGFTLEPITWDGAGLGKVAVPEGYTLNTTVNCCDDTTCLGAPLRVTVAALSDADSTILMFYASESFIERVKSANFKQKNGELDGQTMIFMQEYMDADAYVTARAAVIMSALAGSSNYNYYKDEDISRYDSLLDSHRKYFENLIFPQLGQYGMSADWLEVTAAQKAFTFDLDGVTWAICVMAEVRGYQLSLGVGDVEILWDVPCYYAMICPLSEYERIHATTFRVFAENTDVSDKFNELQDNLTYQIRDQVMNTWSMQIAASNAYVAAMNALMSASVNSYLSSSSYSSSERFSDYIFDRNDYTTSDGYSVKISTGYDYVWEGGNGTVYFSNSAMDVPSGATMLTPN